MLNLGLHSVLASELSAETEQRLQRGEVVVTVMRSSTGAGVQVFAVVDIPRQPHDVWPVMTDCERATKFVPGLISCKILQRDPQGAWDVREHISSPGWPLPTFRTVFRSRYEPNRRVQFSRIAGDLKRSEGEWLIVPRDGNQSTRVIYSAEVEYDTWLPDFLLRDQLAAQMPRVLLALRKESEAVSADGAPLQP